MKLKQFTVKGLYNTFDYTIPFFSDVTFLHGVNGCGKTTILNIITDILSGNPRLQHYDFKEVRLEYINSHKKAKCISITKQDDTHLMRFQNREFTTPLTSVISAIKAEFQGNHISSNMPNKFLEVLNDFYDTRLLSSGEKRLFTLLSNLASNSTKNIVYLIDEPEHSLHIEWQSKLVEALFQLNPKVQLIIATHSPDIISHYDNKAIRLL